MATQEAFSLDGLALNDQTTFSVYEVSWPPPRQRQDWIGAADSEAQLLFRKPLHENRKVTLKVGVVPQASMDVALAKVAQVVDKLDKAGQYSDGIAMVWTPATSTLSCTFDVLAGEISDLPVDWENGWFALAPTFTIELTCKPYWRGAETLTSTASSSTPFVALEIAGVTGDIPALGRLIVTDTATQSRRHVEWGLEGPLTYNSATSLLVDSDNMVTTGFSGVQATTTGAYDPNATGTNSISLSPIGGATTALAGTGNLGHVGVFRVKARVQSGSVSNLFRLSWRAADGPMNHNTWVTAISTVGWQELDLGTITVPAAALGSQRWTGQVEVQGAASSPGTVVLDYLVLVPAGDGYGKARATWSYTPGTLAGQDAFTGTTSGSALNARTAPLGGAWATSGDATDFAFADFVSGEQVSRFSAASTSGRFAVLGTTNYTDTHVEADLLLGLPSASTEFGANGVYEAVVARYVDGSNYLRLAVKHTWSPFVSTLVLDQVVAGSVTTLQSVSLGGLLANIAIGRIRLIVFASGRAIASHTNTNGVVTSIEAASSALATGGALATGKPGLWDFSGGSSVLARYYDNFGLWTPAAEPVAVYSGRSAQFRYDDAVRQDSSGTYYGRPSSYRGSRFLLPVGTSRVLVKARRNDIEEALDDQVTDATQIQVGFTPRGLAVPR